MDLAVDHCTKDEKTLEHVLWMYPLYRDLREELLSGIIRVEEYDNDLVSP